MKSKSSVSKLFPSRKTRSTAAKSKSLVLKSTSAGTKSKSKAPQRRSKVSNKKMPIKTRKPLTVSEAIKISNDYFASVFPNVKEMVVEEIEMSRDGNWLITIGYTGQTRQAFGVPVVQRMYKRFTVDNSTGQVVSMKIVHAI